MPDISKCDGKKCPIKKHCYRFTVKPDIYWQCYANFRYDKKLKTCDDYWDNGTENNTNFDPR